MDKGPKGLSPDEEVAAWMQAATAYYQEEIAPRFENPLYLLSEQCVGMDFTKGDACFLDVEDRNYPTDMPGYVFGTMDLFGTYRRHTSKVVMWVGDWKTGGTDGAEEQLLSLLAASRMAWFFELGSYPDLYEISCLRVGWDPYTETFGVFEDRREVSTEEIEAHVQAMAFQYERYVANEAPAVPGIHCTQLYCPHLAHCEAVGAVVSEAGEADPSYGSTHQLISLESHARPIQMRLNDKPSTNQEAADTMELVSAAKRQLNYITECMKDYCKTTGDSIVSGSWRWGPGKDGFRWRKMKT